MSPRFLVAIALAGLIVVSFVQGKTAQGRTVPSGSCPRPAAGGSVPEPADLRSQNGTLKVDLTIHNSAGPDGSTRYCYEDRDGNQAPTLRLRPGDLLILRLRNELADIDHRPSASRLPEEMNTAQRKGACSSGAMKATSTNLHFHGLTVPAVCHEDDVLRTIIGSGAPRFEYRFHIPENQPPGLYWYHPHVHGFTTTQVLGGASGAMIVEGIERANKRLAGLPERVLVIRDQDLLNPNAPPAKAERSAPKLFTDRDGDAANNGTGFGKPAKDLSINFVPVPYPAYATAVIQMRPEERQLWRVANACAVTYLNLVILVKGKPQAVGLAALDGVPLNENGTSGDLVRWQTHVALAPGGRAEFIVKGPPVGVPALLVTQAVDTGPGGENDPNRALARIEASAEAAEPRSKLASSPRPLPPSTLPWLGSVAPVCTRRLYFSEKLADPSRPSSAVEFYLTVDGQTPTAFDPRSGIPNIVVKQGTVEDWIIENRSKELHAFHIHQLHFMILDYGGVPVNEPFLRDTVNVPYVTDGALTYPSVRLRMDFRDPNTVGTFVYHCHLLEHEDGGMMGVIRVVAAGVEAEQDLQTAARAGKD